MRIAVCGAQALFSSGGAEAHRARLIAELVARGHQADLVQIPFTWGRDELLENALAWRYLTVEADLVIATNFPSYFVRHPRKRVWLFHQHRPAYDAFGTPSGGGFGDRPEDHELREVLTRWDQVTLGEAERLFATSKTVADRLRRFNGLEAEPLYHPPPLAERLHPGGQEPYVFVPCRLEVNKRPEILVRAMAEVTSGVRARIAGTGPQVQRLEREIRELKAPVDLLGFVPDDELVDLYANALGVVYAPFEEDYGYVTLEAFLSEKPVVCAQDSGGVLEFVEDGRNGYVTDGSPASIAKAIEALASDPQRAADMGREGRERVAGLNWNHVVERLLR